LLTPTAGSIQWNEVAAATRSNAASGSAAVSKPALTIETERPRVRSARRAARAAPGSTAVTSAPASSNPSVAWPVPGPISSTRLPTPSPHRSARIQYVSAG
jgi:hypothetical protein